MADAVVFAGPSLDRAAARELLAAEYRPPVRRGDVEPLLRNPPAAIGIVDGVFFQTLAISPKEILLALRAGVRVYGSSSIGALRAVELERYGMSGVGSIFEAYRSGRLDADDEVATTYASDGQRPLSCPLVTIRALLRHARDTGVLEPREAAGLARYAKRLYFPERTLGQVLTEARRRLAPPAADALAEVFCRGTPDPKRDDAMALLETMRRELPPQTS